jgi:small-conductance mechanosensitive channel/CRP-like cAMP-binding protein
MLKIVERLAAPAALFLLFLVSALTTPNLIRTIGADAVARLGDVVSYGIQIGLWVSGAYLIVRLVNVLFWDRLVAGGLGAPVPRLLKDCLAIVVYLIAAAGIIGIVFGQSVAGIWATSGAIGIVLGLALRSIILDIFSGLAVNLEHSYRIGDWVELLDRNGPAVYGRVVEINWRTTRILTDDRRVVVIPNSRMGQAAVLNYSMPSTVNRLEAVFTLDFSVPSARAQRVLLAGARAACGGGGLLDDPPVQVILGAATQLGVEYRVRAWHDVDLVSPSVARGLVTASILRHLASAGLSLAYPKQDTFHAPMPARQLEHQAEADRAKLLERVELFGRSLNESELKRLAGLMAPRLFPAAAALLVEGEPGGSMLVLAEGLLEVRKRRDDGSELVLGKVQAGEFVGEMSLLTGEPRSASVVALTETLAYEITHEHLADLLAARPAISEALSEIVALRRLRTTTALSAAATPQEVAEAHGAARQILAKMRHLFRHVFDRPQAVGAPHG